MKTMASKFRRSRLNEENGSLFFPNTNRNTSRQTQRPRRASRYRTYSKYGRSKHRYFTRRTALFCLAYAAAARSMPKPPARSAPLSSSLCLMLPTSILTE
jgi:hypothetical protein